MKTIRARTGGLAARLRVGAVLAMGLGIVVVSFGFASGPAHAETLPVWSVDAGKSRISFIGRQMGAASKGWFKKFTATIRFDPDKLADSKAEVLVDTASAYTGNSDIDIEMRKDKWFDVVKYPTARFVTTKITAKGKDAYEAAGKLTIKGITKDLVLPFKVALSNGGKTAKITGEVTVKRLDFGVGTGEWGATRIIADEVVVQIDVTANKGG
jgi:polyisoprenoid-binding protein YceI